MKIDIRKREQITILDLDGNIRTNDDYAIFKESIDRLIDEGASRLILNFEKVSFVNSSGLGRLVLAAKKARESGGEIRVSNLSDDLEELFSFTRLDAKIPVHKNEEEAYASFGS